MGTFLSRRCLYRLPRSHPSHSLSDCFSFGDRHAFIGENGSKVYTLPCINFGLFHCCRVWQPLACSHDFMWHISSAVNFWVGVWYIAFDVKLLGNEPRGEEVRVTVSCNSLFLLTFS